MIRLNHPVLPTVEELLPRLKEIDQSDGYYTNGSRLVQELEQYMGAAVQADAVCVTNATLGIELTLQALGLRRKRILVPAFTFRATITAIHRAGAFPVLADVDEHTWTLTPEIAERHRGRFDAVLPVCTFGCSIDPEPWGEFGRRNAVPVVLDAAAAFGNQDVGDFTAIVVSLHATKPLAAGEGGFVASHDRILLHRIRGLANFEEVYATNAKMSEYHAAVALTMYDRWSDIVEDRHALQRRYLQRLTGFSWIAQDRPLNSIPSTMALRLPGQSGREIVHELRKAGVESKRWYCPTADEWLGNTSVGLDFTQQLREELVGLPFHLRLSDGEIDQVVETLRRLL